MEKIFYHSNGITVVTVLSDGSITVSRRELTGPTEPDRVTLTHLSSEIVQFIAQTRVKNAV